MLALTETKYKSITEDDLEDMLRGFIDVIKGQEFELLPASVKHWYNCQLEWWLMPWSSLSRGKHIQEVKKTFGNCKSFWFEWQRNLVCKTDLKMDKICKKKELGWMDTALRYTSMVVDLDSLFNLPRYDSDDNVSDDESGWWFRRVQRREDHLTDPSWYFERMKSHDVDRNKDDSRWYLKMMDESRKKQSDHIREETRHRRERGTTRRR